jgi:hypothetical protein
MQNSPLVERIEDLLANYHGAWRSKDLRALTISWRRTIRSNEVSGWPNGLGPGVYLVFDQSEETVLYVGRACGPLQKRLDKHFEYFASYGPETYESHKWKGRAALAATIAVNAWHEVLSLEAYLIRELDPPGNKHFRLTKTQRDRRHFKHRHSGKVEWEEWKDGKLWRIAIDDHGSESWWSLTAAP